MLRSKPFAAVCFVFAMAMSAHAQPPAPSPDSGEGRKLDVKTGKLTIGSNEVVMNLPDGFVYLTKADARYVLEDLWKNPPDPRVDALILPGTKDGPAENQDVAVIVTLERDGHIDDSDAKKTDYDELLSNMQDETKESSEERVKHGYDSVELVGWAEPPHYDASTKKLYWAKHLRFNGSDEVLNYDVRILGRKTTLVLRAISSMENLKQVGPVCQTLLGVTEFTPGNTHSDFNPSVDKVAAYGIGGLIAGKVLLKVGLFAKFFAVIVKFGKFVAIGVIAALGALKRLFTRRPAAPTP